jgi:DNA-binding transcriptional MerR regulator
LSRFVANRTDSDWLGLGEASRLLGVAPGTLRRWSDTGQLVAFTTPGGHRRYRRSSLERLIPAERQGRPSIVRSGMTPARLARVYRREARSTSRQLDWVVGLTGEQRDWFRHHGRRLAEALLANLDSEDDELAAASLADATGEAADYGRMAAELGVSLSVAVESFLRFRLPFMHQLALVARRRDLGGAATAELMEDAERLMDRLLVAAMNAHTVQRVVETPLPAHETDGLR